MDDQLQVVQRPACKGIYTCVEIDFKQVGGSGRVVLVENRSASGQFNNSGSDVYGALISYCEWYDACDAIRATPTQDNVTGRKRRDAQAFPYCKSSITLTAIGGFQTRRSSDGGASGAAIHTASGARLLTTTAATHETRRLCPYDCLEDEMLGYNATNRFGLCLCFGSSTREAIRIKLEVFV